MSDPKLLLIDMEAVMRAETERLERLDAPAATDELLRAVDELAKAEARRLDVGFLDRTYHGCDPHWRAVLDAAADLRAVRAREQNP